MISYYIFFQFKKFISIGLCVFRNIFHKNILSTSAEMGISDYCFFDVDPNIFYDIIKSYKFSSWKKNFKINIEHIAICFYAPGSRKGGCYYSYMVLQHKKAWESDRYSSHKQRLWHCPVWLNEQRRNPRRYVLKHISTEFLSAMLRTQKLRKMNAYIHIPQASTVALSVTIP